VTLCFRSFLAYVSLNSVIWFEHTITSAEHRKPIRKILSFHLPEISQIRLRRLIADSQVAVNGNPIRSTYRGIVGDSVSLSVLEEVITAFLPEPLPLTIVFEDAELLVVDKPAGMLVHPSNSQKSGTLLNAVCHHLKETGQSGIRPGLIHRLDRQTSGLIVLAKNERSHRVLAKHFTNHLVEKTYLGIVIGRVPEETGIIDAPIGSNKETFPHWQIMESGRPSRTQYRVLSRYHSTKSDLRFSLLELTPETGRTNQLRIHLASIGFPLVNDYVYGKEENEAVFGSLSEISTNSRHFLHAAGIKFRHPVSGDWVALESPMPSDMNEFIESVTLEEG